MTTAASKVPNQDALVSEYRRTGVLVLEGWFSPAEIAGWDAECGRLLTPGAVPQGDPRVARRAVGGTQVIERFDPVVDVSPVFERLAKDPRVLGLVGALLGDEPLLFKDKLIFKVPGMSGYDMHQDWAWWPFAPPDAMLSVQVAIDAATAANGALELFPGYQQTVLSPKGAMRNLLPEEVKRVDLSKSLLLKSRPGDIAIFHALTPHQSGPNHADTSRRSFYLTFAAASHGDLREAYYRERRERLASTGIVRRAARAVKRLLGGEP